MTLNACFRFIFEHQTDYISPRLARMMIDHGSEACFMKDENGFLPVHVACSRHCSPEKLRMLLAVNPQSLFEKTHKGDTILDLAKKTATKSHPNIALIDELGRQLGQQHPMPQLMMVPLYSYYNLPPLSYGWYNTSQPNHSHLREASRAATAAAVDAPSGSGERLRAGDQLEEEQSRNAKLASFLDMNASASPFAASLNSNQGENSSRTQGLPMSRDSLTSRESSLHLWTAQGQQQQQPWTLLDDCKPAARPQAQVSLQKQEKVSAKMPSSPPRVDVGSAPASQIQLEKEPVTPPALQSVAQHACVTPPEHQSDRSSQPGLPPVHEPHGPRPRQESNSAFSEDKDGIKHGQQALLSTLGSSLSQQAAQASQAAPLSRSDGDSATDQIANASSIVAV